MNGLLTNCEVWHNLHESEINKLKEINRLLLRKIFQVQSTCPAESLYFELGFIPLGIIIETRRLNYLHHLVTRNEDEMIKKTFVTQWNNPKKGDWAEFVRKNLKMFGMDEELIWIKAKSKSSFKAFLRSKANELTLQILLNKKKNHSKMKNHHFSDLKIRAYLKNEKSTETRASIRKSIKQKCFFSEEVKRDYFRDILYLNVILNVSTLPIIIEVIGKICSIKFPYLK